MKALNCKPLAPYASAVCMKCDFEQTEALVYCDSSKANGISVILSNLAYLKILPDHCSYTGSPLQFAVTQDAE